MKGQKIFSVVMFFLVCACFVFCCSVSAAEQNLFQNPGFEEAEGGNPAFWTSQGPVLWANEGHSGSRCAVVKASGWALWQQEVVMQPGVKYVFGGWMKSAEGEATVQVVFADAKPSGYNKNDKYIKVGPAWKFYQVDYTPSEVTRTPVKIWLLNEAQKTDLYFDDVSLTAISTVETTTAPQPQVSTPSTPGKNLLTNSNFEEADPSDPNKPLGWGAQGSCEWAKKGRNDSYCVISKQSPWSLWKQPVSIQGGKKYMVSAWMRADQEGVFAQVVFSGMKPEGNGKHDLYFKPTTSWKYYSAQIEPSEVNNPVIWLLNEAQKADLYFDDVSVIEMSSGASSSQTQATPSVQAKLPDIATNLTPEGDCEKDSRSIGTPDGWHKADPKYISKSLSGDFFFDPSQHEAKYGWENKGYHSKRSLSIQVEKPGKFGEWELETHNIRPNTNYNLSFRYWQPVGKTIQVALFGQVFSPTHPRGFEQWLYATYNVNSGNVTGDSSIGFFVYDPEKPVRVLIDAVRLCEGEVEKDSASGMEWTLGQIIGQNQARLTYFTYEEGYISPDMASSLAFSIDFRFLTKPVPPFLQVNLDLPPEVEFADYETFYWESVKGSSRLEKTPITHNDKPYTRYTIFYPVTRTAWTHPSHPGYRHVFCYLKTGLASGSVDAYYSLKWDGGEQPEIKLPLQVVRIPEVKPSKFLIMEDIRLEMLRAWPNALENLKRLGINWVMYQGKFLKNPDQQSIKDIESLKQAGFNLAAWMNVLDTYPQDQSSWALDVNGKQIKAGGFGGSPCFTKRGKGYQEMVANAKKYVDAGITGFFFDDEGRTDCYCADCLKVFRQYLADNAPEVNFVDPRDFMKDPGKSPKLNVLWYDCSRWSYANIVNDLRKELLSYMQAKGIDTKKLLLHDGGIPIGDKNIDRVRGEQKMSKPESLYKFYGQAFDYYGEQIYINCYDWGLKGLPNLGGDQQAKLTAEYVPCGLKQMPLPGADLTYMDPMNDFQPHAVMKCQLLEMACAGISGYYIYPFGDIDLMDMKYMNEALSVIQKVEDIVMKGSPEDWAKSKQGSIRTLKSGDERLVCVSEYSTFEDVPITIQVACPVKENLNVIEVETGKFIAMLSPAKNTFQVHLGKERCKVFYLGKKTKI